MNAFLVTAGVIAWCVLTVLAPSFLVYRMIETDDLRAKLLNAAAALILFVGSLAGLLVTADANGLFDNPYPANGCYRISRYTTDMVVPTSESVMVVPQVHVVFDPIACSDA